MHAAYVPVPAGVSNLHSNVEPAIDDVNVNDGAVTFVAPVGPPVMFVSGAGGGVGVGVAVGVGVGVAAGSTMIVAFMFVAWIWQISVYVPGLGRCRSPPIRCPQPLAKLPGIGGAGSGSIEPPGEAFVCGQDVGAGAPSNATLWKLPVPVGYPNETL